MDEKGNLHKTVLNTLLLNPFCIRIILTNLSILYLSIDFTVMFMLNFVYRFVLFLHIIAN